jgi:hypothetical protein
MTADADYLRGKVTGDGRCRPGAAGVGDYGIMNQTLDLGAIGVDEAGTRQATRTFPETSPAVTRSPGRSPVGRSITAKERLKE